MYTTLTNHLFYNYQDGHIFANQNKVEARQSGYGKYYKQYMIG